MDAMLQVEGVILVDVPLTQHLAANGEILKIRLELLQKGQTIAVDAPFEDLADTLAESLEIRLLTQLREEIRKLRENADKSSSVADDLEGYLGKPSKRERGEDA